MFSFDSFKCESSCYLKTTLEHAKNYILSKIVVKDNFFDNMLIKNG